MEIPRQPGAFGLGGGDGGSLALLGEEGAVECLKRRAAEGRVGDDDDGDQKRDRQQGHSGQHEDGDQRAQAGEADGVNETRPTQHCQVTPSPAHQGDQHRQRHSNDHGQPKLFERDEGGLGEDAQRRPGSDEPDAKNEEARARQPAACRPAADPRKRQEESEARSDTRDRHLALNGERQAGESNRQTRERLCISTSARQMNAGSTGQNEGQCGHRLHCLQQAALRGDCAANDGLSDAGLDRPTTRFVRGLQSKHHLAWADPVPPCEAGGVNRTDGGAVGFGHDSGRSGTSERGRQSEHRDDETDHSDRRSPDPVHLPFRQSLLRLGKTLGATRGFTR